MPCNGAVLAIVSKRPPKVLTYRRYTPPAIAVKDLFYTPDLQTDTQTLAGDQFRHAVRVMRKRAGDQLMFTDGAGTLATVVLKEVGKREATFQVQQSEVIAPRNYTLSVAVAPTKNTKRIEWALEKMIEMGVDRFVPIRCDHSERLSLKVDRLNAIAISAMKQSQQVFLPRVEEMISLSDYIAQQASLDVAKFIGYKDDSSSSLVDNYSKGRDVSFLIGPEGDFSDREIELAREAGFVPVILGENRLRTETAAVMAVAAIHTLNM